MEDRDCRRKKQRHAHTEIKKDKEKGKDVWEYFDKTTRKQSKIMLQFWVKVS